MLLCLDQYEELISSDDQYDFAMLSNPDQGNGNLIARPPRWYG